MVIAESAREDLDSQPFLQNQPYERDATSVMVTQLAAWNILHFQEETKIQKQ